MNIALLFTSILPSLQVPPKVTGVSVSKDTKNGKPSLRVTWTALQNVANLSEYRVQYSRSGDLLWGNTSTENVQPNSTSTFLLELLPGTEYNVRVKAVSAAGDGEWSEVHTEATYNSEFIHLHVPLSSCDIRRHGSDVYLEMSLI